MVSGYLKLLLSLFYDVLTMKNIILRIEITIIKKILCSLLILIFTKILKNETFCQNNFDYIIAL